MSKLYLVGTPIGNLGDMSPRGVATLEAVDFIAAEDTRVSIKLLNHYGIQKSMLSYHEHNQREMGDRIVSRLLAGESCAVITDAGMPCISDPGEQLVRLCAEQGIETVVVPGPSAVVAAVAVSGLATGRFCFEGFLSVRKSSRFAHLEMLRDEERTMVFYEAPHKLLATLRDMNAVLGDRRITLARELTKLHEEVIRTTLGEAAAYYEKGTVQPRGEFVLVVEGAPPKAESAVDFNQAVGMVQALTGQGTGISQAAREVARETGYKKGELYRAALGELQ